MKGLFGNLAFPSAFVRNLSCQRASSWHPEKDSCQKHAGMTSFQLIFVLTTVLLASCGFQLKGHYQLPEALRTLKLEANSIDPSLLQYLKRSLGRANVAIVDDATYILRLEKEKYSRRTITVTEEAKTAEYELRLEVNFSLFTAEKTIIPTTTLIREKTYFFDKNQLLGKKEEEELLKQEMWQEVIDQLVYRLETINPKLLK